MYYELYMEIFDKMAVLEMYFSQLCQGGMPMSELYSKVQVRGCIVGWRSTTSPPLPPM